MSEIQNILPEDVILSKIYLIRGEKVMLDRDLAILYGVETRVLKQQVKRNLIRFPSDFMFELTKEEFENWRSQTVISNSDKMGLRHVPMAFTEDGVAQLSTILNSERAIKVNIQIIRMFGRMRRMILTQKDILQKLEQLDKKDIEQDEKITLIFKYIKQLELYKQQELEQQQRSKIGYK